MVLWQLFYTFFIIGFVSFGGGYAMIPIIETEVMQHEWMTSEQLTNMIAIAGMSPGPIAISSNCNYSCFNWILYRRLTWSHHLYSWSITPFPYFSPDCSYLFYETSSSSGCSIHVLRIETDCYESNPLCSY